MCKMVRMSVNVIEDMILNQKADKMNKGIIARERPQSLSLCKKMAHVQ